MLNDKSTSKYIVLVRLFAIVLGLVQAGSFALAWLAPEAMHLGAVAIWFWPRGMAPGAVAALTPAMHASGIACALPALLLLGYALLRLDRMLRACAGGRMFAVDTVGHMKAFTGCILGALLLTIVEPVLRGAVWRFGLGAPVRAVNVGVSSEELTLVLICALFFVVASMLHEARRLAEDNEGFV